MDIGTEVINISETVNDGAVVLINEDLFEDNGLDADAQLSVVNSLFILAYDHLNADLKELDGTELINISPDPVLYDLVSMVRMILLNKNNDFQLLVYFGKKANKKTTLKKGLLHILELLSTVEAGIV